MEQPWDDETAPAHESSIGAPLDAGPLGVWLDHMSAAMRGDADADVSCGSCTACCSSRQFVLVSADEVDTLAHVPSEWHVPAPGRPGDVVIGHDRAGRCPMLGEHGCTIYDHRPRTCRTYDCRIFVATGIPVDDDQPLVAAQARRWRFDTSSPDDARRHRALRLTAEVIADPAAHPDGRVPPRAVQRASITVGLHRLAFDGDVVRAPAAAAVRVELERRRA